MEKQDKKDKAAQPPPRKGKVATALRNIHNEQLLKLQMKHQQDADFLEDIRIFTKMRAAVEKEYAQALLKLATSYLQRKFPTVPEMKTESGDSYKTVYAVWKTLLDETEKIAKARLAATEVYQQQVSESAKSLRLYKLQVAKKCFDNLRKMHDEIQQCVVEIDKSKKLYFEEEHMAHEARDKAHDADEKLKRKKGRIFQSISSLQKNSAKFSFRREACDIQATKARNDYVLALVAANAHQVKYYDVDLPELIQSTDCDIYDKVKEYILLISRTELLTCAACQSAFSIVQEQADMATKQYTMECFFHDNPVLSQALLYEFEPCDNDKINKLSIEHNAGLCLSREARRWATCVAKETRVVRDSKEELKKLNAQIADKPPFTVVELGPQAEIEIRIDDLRQIIRRAQTSKKKAEARLEAMIDSGVNVEEWARTTESESVSTDVSADALSRSGTVTSRRSQKSYPSADSYEVGSDANDAFYDSDNATEPPSATVEGMNEDPFTAELASAVDVVAAVQHAWDAAAGEEEEEEFIEPEPMAQEEAPQQLEAEPAVNGQVSPASTSRCVALFSYQASNQDEISFVEQEELELISEGDGDGWIKARNYRGEEGYIPQNYVEVAETSTTGSSPRPPLTSFSSVDYSIPQEDEGIPAPSQAMEETLAPVVNEEVAMQPPAVLDDQFAPTMGNGQIPPAVLNGQFPPAVLNGQVPPAAVLNGQVPPAAVLNGQIRPAVLNGQIPPEAVEVYSYCRATYDYEATCDEELTFFESQVVRIIRKTVTDVDDGWWEGEVDGKIGLFPSLVVEELKDNGEPMTPIDVISPISCFPPPVFTPPQPIVQSILVLPAQVILTQPTPEIEHPSSQKPPLQKAIAITMDNPDFQIELTEQQQSQYHHQFSASDSESSEQEVPVPEDPTKYAPLVSSPDSPTKAAATGAKETVLEKISEEKTEPESSISPSGNDAECPKVVITEAQFAHFDDEFLYQEDKNIPKGEITKEIHDAYQNADAFECTFPDTTAEDTNKDSTEEAAKSSGGKPVEEAKTTSNGAMKPDENKKTVSAMSEDDDRHEQDDDVKMEFTCDESTESTKTQNDFFEVTG